MAGPRFPGWTHKHSAGKGGEAAPYLSEARKLMGFVMEDAAHNGLVTHKAERTLADGTKLVAQKHGSVPRMTIIPMPGKKSDVPPKVKENFVIRLRNDELPNGIDEDVPETLERVDGESWRTLFHTRSTPGFEGFAGKKGTYKTSNGKVVFPDGVNHAGNVDWRGPDGVRLSWYGPSTRYFYDPYVLPRAQYGKFVFMLGQVLLDVDQYAVDSEDDFGARWVMGAALEGETSLLVVHASLPESVSYPTGTAPPGDMHVSQPWPVGPVDIEVVRYSLVPSEERSAPYLSVVSGSRNVLLSVSIGHALNPWFFSPDATAAVSHALPETVLTRPTNDFASLAEAPSVSSQIAFLTVEGDAASIGTTNVSLAPDTEAALASDWLEDGNRVDLLAIRTRNDGGFDTRGLRLGNHVALVRHVHGFRQIDGRPGSTFDRRHLVWADLREGVLVIAHRQSHQRLNATSPTKFRRIEVWQNGVQVDFWQQNMRSELEGEFSGMPRLGGSYADDFDDQEANHARNVAYAPATVLYEMLDYSPTVSGRRYWQGAHGLYLNLAYPAESYFGSYVAGRAPEGNPYVEIKALAAQDAAFNYVQKDVHDRASVVGCASYGGVTVYSGWQVNVGGYADDQHFVTFTAPFYPDFPTLGGEDARCLPVWLLGALPRNAGIV